MYIRRVTQTLLFTYNKTKLEKIENYQKNC